MDLLDDMRSRLVVAARDEERRRRDLVQPVGDVPRLQRADAVELARAVHRVVDSRAAFAPAFEPADVRSDTPNRVSGALTSSRFSRRSRGTPRRARGMPPAL